MIATGGGSSGAECDAFTTLAECEAQAGCYPVFFDPATCGCAIPGCCAQFLMCVFGTAPSCDPPAQFACTIQEPFCEQPYVLSYRNGCYEGCVLAEDCATP